MPGFKKLASMASVRSFQSLLFRYNADSTDEDEWSHPPCPPRSVSSSSTSSSFLSMSMTLFRLPKRSKSLSERRQVRAFIEAVPHINTTNNVAKGRDEQLQETRKEGRRASYPAPPKAPAIMISLDDAPGSLLYTLALRTLDIAARQTLMYADQMHYASSPNQLPPPWNHAELRGLAQDFLTTDSGWEVRYRCEGRPGLVFRLETDNEKTDFWKWLDEEWHKATECSHSEKGSGGTQENKDMRLKKGRNNNKKRRRRKGMVNGRGKHEKKSKSKDNDDLELEVQKAAADAEREERALRANEDADLEWVCFSKKKGVMRVDLTVHFTYLAMVPVEKHASAEIAYTQ
ncbi:hypothetical protein M406DRAFT_326034 [Cryphonectria parasitica EP155]|uniref:Uncharacterized protein n=1 Tax=Cryphonectria parasitica (strain ATCC 38755 / EP155) TaxID=660469 RepID=A0A9P4YCJ5_CRYP1|nr:uncharacterized protein M406DRAFT_326034 [Cryphonectria parasitica EP155]KAF3770588.1 hypothetical protein M406DRAFT_326034 [Cryphonectria parasitica EP155]